jgi:hypothetical protein
MGGVVALGFGQGVGEGVGAFTFRLCFERRLALGSRLSVGTFSRGPRGGYFVPLGLRFRLAA